MSRRNFYLFLFFLLPLIYFLSLPIAVGDLAIWIAQGSYFLKTGSLLRHDIYSILPTQDLVYPAGACILYAFIYSWGGLLAVSLMHKLVVLALSAIWWKSSLSKLRSPWSLQTVAVILLAWFGMASLCVDRPALLATMPFLLSYLILEKQSDLSWSDILLLNGINILWVNLHGSWLLLIIMFAWRELMRRLLRFEKSMEPRVILRSVIGLLSLGLSSLANPFGLQIFKYVIETVRVSRERGIAEWRVTSFSGQYTSQGIAFYFVFLFSIGCLFYWFKTRRDFNRGSSSRQKAMMFLTSPFVILLVSGMFNVRNTIWVFVALIPAAAQLGFLRDDHREEKKSFINVAIIVGLIALVVALLPPFKEKIFFLLPPEKRALFDSSAPIAFVKILNNSPDRAPVFNDWEYGSYLALAQKHPIFMDSRNIIYDAKEFQDYLDILEANPNWGQILAHYQIGYVLLNKVYRTNLIEALHASTSWQLLLEDKDTVLFKRVR